MPPWKTSLNFLFLLLLLPKQILSQSETKVFKMYKQAWPEVSRHLTICRAKCPLGSAVSFLRSLRTWATFHIRPVNLKSRRCYAIIFHMLWGREWKGIGEVQVEKLLEFFTEFSFNFFFALFFSRYFHTYCKHFLSLFIYITLGTSGT